LTCFGQAFVLGIGAEVVFEPAEDLVGADGVAVPQQPLDLV
jgi:hypothetical protein